MTQLQWQDVRPEGAQASQPTQRTTGPWFGISMGLLGIIVGFILGSVLR